MRKMKKFVSCLLAGIVITSLAACGNSDQDPGTAEEGNGDGNEQTSEEDSSWADVESAGVLRIGCEGNWKPFIYNDEDDKLVGSEVEIANEMAARMGLETEWDVASEWTGVVAGLDADRYDCIFEAIPPASYEGEAYDNKYLCSIPYGEKTQVLVVNEDSDIESWEDLDGKVCGNSLSSSSGKIAESYGATLTEMSLTDSMQLLSEARGIDATVNALISINDYLAQKPDTKVKIAAYYEPDDPRATYMTVLFRAEDQTLREKANEALQSMLDDGTIYEIMVKYFTEDVADVMSVFVEHPEYKGQ